MKAIGMMNIAKIKIFEDIEEYRNIRGVEGIGNTRLYHWKWNGQVFEWKCGGKTSVGKKELYQSVCLLTTNNCYVVLSAVLIGWYPIYNTTKGLKINASFWEDRDWKYLLFQNKK